MNFAYRAGEINEYIINIRRHIHAHPELSFNERKTTAYIADKLEEMGVEVQRFDDYTGCIGTIRGRNGGKTVLLRADIDALPGLFRPDTKLVIMAHASNVCGAVTC